jgi:Spy/CpxP family protein refolding chaperone
MKPNRNVLGASLLAAGALLAAAAGTVVATAADVATTTTATPPPGPGPHGWHHRGGPGHLLSQLGLSAQQKQQIKAIFAAARPQMQSLHEQIHANSLKLQQTSPSDPNYTSITSSVSQTHGSLSAQALTQRAEVRAQIFKVLTPAQQTQLTTLEAQRQAQIQAHKHGPWGGPNAAPSDQPPSE